MSLKKVDNSIYKTRRFIQGPLTYEDLHEAVMLYVPNDIKVLFVHISYDAFSTIYEGNPMDFMDVFQKLLQRDVTLMFPTFSNILEPLNKYFRKHPVFDVEKTPSGMGLITELFRRHPEAKRSLHPTHSVVAIGPLADELVSEHHLIGTDPEARSPLAKMLEWPAMILGVGVEYYRVLTHVHVVEELMGTKFPVDLGLNSKVKVLLVDKHKRRIPFFVPCSENGKEPAMDITRIRKFNMDGGMITWRIRGIPFYYTSANRLVDEMINGAKRDLTIYPQ